MRNIYFMLSQCKHVWERRVWAYALALCRASFPQRKRVEGSCISPDLGRRSKSWWMDVCRFSGNFIFLLPGTDFNSVPLISLFNFFVFHLVIHAQRHRILIESWINYVFVKRILHARCNAKLKRIINSEALKVFSVWVAMIALCFRRLCEFN